MDTAPVGAVGAPNLNTGLNVNNVVQQLVAVESRPLQQLHAAESRLQASISSYGQLNGLTARLENTANRLDSPDLWSQLNAFSSSPSALEVMMGDSKATSGQYLIDVQALARSQSLASEYFEEPDSQVGGGSVEISVGAWGSGFSVFNAQVTHANIAISVGARLTDVRDLINGSRQGVTAAIVTDSNGSRLTLTGAESGMSKQIRVRVSDLTEGSRLQALSFAPDLGEAAMRQTQAASNARLSINGLAIESESNTLEGVLDGISLHLRGTTSSPVTVSVAANPTGPKRAIRELVSAYNGLNRFLNDQTSYDPAAQRAGSLEGDRLALELRDELQGLFNGTGGHSSAYDRLAEIGLVAGSDGAVEIDDGRLEQVLANDLAEVSKLFRSDLSGGDGGQAGALGFAPKLGQFASQALGADGMISSHTQRLGAEIRSLQTEQERVNSQIDQYRARLLAQYTALDTNTAQAIALGGSVLEPMPGEGAGAV